MDKDTIRQAVFAYSEWLDADQHLLSCPDEDERTHEELVQQFLNEYLLADPEEDRFANLAGTLREPRWGDYA